MSREIELDIAMMAGFLLAEGKIDLGDSREFVCCRVPELAKEFYEKHNLKERSPLEDYMQLIDDFSEEQLLDLYGIDNQD